MNTDDYGVWVYVYEKVSQPRSGWAEGGRPTMTYEAASALADNLGRRGCVAHVKRIGVSQVVSPLRLPAKLAALVLVALLLAPWSSPQARGYGGHSLGRAHLGHSNSASTHLHARR